MVPVRLGSTGYVIIRCNSCDRVSWLAYSFRIDGSCSCWCQSMEDVYTHGFELSFRSSLGCQVRQLCLKQQWLVLIAMLGNHHFSFVLKQGVSFREKKSLRLLVFGLCYSGILYHLKRWLLLWFKKPECKLCKMKVSEVNAGKHHNMSLTTLFAYHMGRLKTTKIGECHEFFGNYSCVACDYCSPVQEVQINIIHLSGEEHVCITVLFSMCGQAQKIYAEHRHCICSGLQMVWNISYARLGLLP